MSDRAAMTNLEKRLASAHKRIAGYCKTRGWKCGPPVKISDGWRCAQYEVHISDRYGAPAAVAFALYGNEPLFLDDCGIRRDFNVTEFENAVAEFTLTPKPFTSKRQLQLDLGA